MTRIIGGSARGRRLSVPSTGTRPTSDRIREALFSSLDSWLLSQERSWLDIWFADLYAGSGAIGLEAASRGAANVVLVEQQSGALKTIGENIERTRLSVVTERSNVSQWKPRHAFDVIFMDPPYSSSDQEVAETVLRLSFLPEANSALFVIERGLRSGDPFDRVDPGYFHKKWDRIYGDTRLWYGHLVGGIE